MDLTIEGLPEGVALEDTILQRHLEAFYSGMRAEFRDWRNLPMIEVGGAYCRAAIKAKVLTGISPKDLAELPPVVVQAVAREIDELIGAAITIPPA